MPSPGSGSPGTIVSPIEPEKAHDADNADPGQVESVKAGERQVKKGKYGSQQVKPFKAAAVAEGAPAKEPSWIEVKLLDASGHPVAGERYAVTLPDGAVASGTTDENGKARVEGFEAGQCKVSFPNLDKTVVEEK